MVLMYKVPASPPPKCPGPSSNVLVSLLFWRFFPSPLTHCLVILDLQPKAGFVIIWYCLFPCFPCFIPQVNEIIYYFSFSLWLILLNLMPFSYIQVLMNCKVSSFLIVISHCIMTFFLDKGGDYTPLYFGLTPGSVQIQGSLLMGSGYLMGCWGWNLGWLRAVASTLPAAPSLWPNILWLFNAFICHWTFMLFLYAGFCT